MKTLVRAAVLTGICLGAANSPAEAADYIFTPFAGKTFAAQHTLVTTSGLPVVASVDKQTWLVGASAAWLTSSVLGAEIDVGYVPRLFRSNQSLTTAGNALSLTGNVLVAVPLSVTGYSLRPYFSGGMGMLHAGVGDVAQSSTEIDRNLLAMSLGGGAIGFFTNRTGVRFDLRHIRSTSRGQDFGTLLDEPRLGFWRATVGVAIRY